MGKRECLYFQRRKWMLLFLGKDKMKSAMKYPLTTDECFDGKNFNKKISDEFGQWQEPTISIDDLRKWKKELDEKGIQERKFPETIIIDFNETHYQLSGGAHGFVSKKVWNEIMLKLGVTKP